MPVGYFWHAPFPSHLPLVPHDAEPPSLHCLCGSSLPAPTLRQLPGDPPAVPQLLQASPHALSQQNPSTQNPESHWLAFEHVAPLGRVPHWWVVVLHVRLGAQSISLLHVVAHAPERQTKGSQGCWIGCKQEPLPSQDPGVLRTLPVHDGRTQVTP